MAYRPDGEIVADDNGRPIGTCDIDLLSACGFACDCAAERPARPVEPAATDDRDERTPGWRRL